MTEGRRVMLAALLVFAVFSPRLLQAQNLNGALRGEVEDSTGARMPGARVQTQMMGTSFTREAIAGTQGEFLLEA